MLIFVLTYGMGCIIFTISIILSNRSSENTFYMEFGLDENNNNYNLIVGVYFALTTLSTVGYGDYYPINGVERIITVIF
jgi:hypothetical protein